MSEANQAVMERIVEASSRIIGTVRILVDIYKEYPEETTAFLDFCEKNGITGSAIWCWYKDECKQDIEKLVKSFRNVEKNPNILFTRQRYNGVKLLDYLKSQAN